MQNIKDDNTREYEIDGKKGNRYFWSQKMRALETEIRKSKDEINALKAFGHSVPQINDLQQRIKAFRAKYDQIAEITGIDPEPKRLTVQKVKIEYENGGVSGARNPYSEKAQEHANKYYGLIRSMKTDVSKISKSTGFSEDKIQEVKDFIFNEKHDLGNAEKEYFKPDYMMAESWKRLIDGKPEPHDITLINHEIMEHDLMKQGYTQAEAHIITSKKYNYDKEATEFYDKIEKYMD